jgi:hypothetical protein
MYTLDRRKEFFKMNEEMSYKQGKYVDLLDRFTESGLAMCEVEINDEELLNVEAGTVSARIQASARRFGRPHIRAITNKGKVYLINKLKG